MAAAQTPPEGLTTAEIARRVAAGQVNRFVKAPTRSRSLSIVWHCPSSSQYLHILPDGIPDPECVGIVQKYIEMRARCFEVGFQS